MSGDIIKILSWTYQFLIALKIAKNYTPEIGNLMETFNWHVSADCFLIICSECIMKITPVPLIKAL